jgi:hypothetical protein
MPAPEQRESLKQQHGYAEWAGRSAMPGDRTLRLFAFTGNEMPGHRLERSERREIPGQPPRVTSFWRRGDTPAVVRVDLFEGASVGAAHEYLIEALGEFESAAIGRRPDVNFGDVSFGTDSVALFARGNLVVLVRKATPHPEAVTGIARAIDALILGRVPEG